LDLFVTFVEEISSEEIPWLEEQALSEAMILALEHIYEEHNQLDMFKKEQRC
jgi:hypothetical protein